MSTQLTNKTPANVAAFESALIGGDLSKLTPDQRVAYYNHTCESLGLNPLTKPFEYIRLNGKETLYAKRDCTDQLRKIHGVSIKIVSRDRIEDLLVVTAQASLTSGRFDESVAAVAVGSLKGEALANAMMKAETKAKRRVTLSICGLGMLDETEVSTIPGAIHTTEAPKKLSAEPHFAPAPHPVYGPTDQIQKPWDKAFPVNIHPQELAGFIGAAQANKPPDEKEQFLGNYKIPGGALKGIALEERPDAFWGSYKLELQALLPQLPDDRRIAAEETIKTLTLYLERE